MQYAYRHAISVLTLFLALVIALPAHAQSDDDDPSYPTVDFAVKAMQGAQFFRTDFDNADPASDQAEFGFQRVRYNFEVTARLHERITAFVDIAHEPNDFGTGGNSFAPAVDYAALDLMLTDELTFRFGTPVTGPFHFRGYSDGAATQGNPVIGNSPIDFVTAETGVALIGNFDGGFGFDVTVTSPTFFETFAPGTGLTLIAKGKYATETFGVGAAVMQATNGGTAERVLGLPGAAGMVETMNPIRGDGENYSASGLGQPNRYTHAYLTPGIQNTILHLDAMVKASIVEADVWGGVSLESYSFAANGTAQPIANPGLANFNNFTIIEEDSQLLFAGATLKINATDFFHVATRVSYADNASDWASDLGETSLFRVQAGIGVSFWDHAMWKLEFVTQDEGVNSPGQVGANWYGVLTELSIGF